MVETVAKYDHAIKIALTRLVDLRENVWLEKVDKKTIISELDSVISRLSVNNNLRNKEVAEMIEKLSKQPQHGPGHR